MDGTNQFLAEGVIPATLVVFKDDFSIDMVASRKHLRDVASVGSLSGITVNGHASEIHSFTVLEQQKLLAASLEEVGSEIPLVSGVYADGSDLAGKIAKIAADEGASALLVFPPNSMSMGGQLRPEMALRHFQTIADATDLPLILFQYPAITAGYPLQTMLEIFESTDCRSYKGLVQRSNASRTAYSYLHSLPRR